MTVTTKSRGRARSAEKLMDRLQVDMAEAWPDLDCEVGATQEDEHFRVSLRLAVLGLIREYDQQVDRQTRAAAAYLKRRIHELTGRKVSIVLCPRRRQHADHRAPRFSHYDGATWIFSTAP